MSDWLNAILFGVAVFAFVMGLTSVIMGATASKKMDNIMQQRVEYGFFGVSGFIICALLVYALL